MQKLSQLKQIIILLAGFMLCGNFLMAQPYVIKGRILDALSLKPVAFVNILIIGSSSSGVSDIDGKFTLNLPEPVSMLKLSCFGYEPAEILTDLSGNELIIKLKKQEDGFQERIISQDLEEAQHTIDSIRKADNAGTFDKTNAAIIDGRATLSMFYLDMNRFIHYNRYQGLYLGLGLHTSDKLSTRFSIGGYWGYGFASKSATYGADGTIVLDRHSETNLKIEFSHDVSESGGLPYFGEIYRFFDPSNFHNLLVERMDVLDLRQVTVSTGIVKYLRTGISFSQSMKTPTYDYAYVRSQGTDIAVLDKQFNFSGLSFNLRYAYGEKPVSKSRAGISPGLNYPVIKMQFTRGFDSWPGSDYTYTRIDLIIEKSFQTKHMGRTFLCLQAGAASGNLPYCNLFDGRGGYGKFTIYAPRSFVTMRMNEFVSDRYTSFFFTQNFGKLLKPSRHFNPELAWNASTGFGDLAHPEKHRGINILTLTKGYFESGLLINNLVDLKVYNIGLGAFYRLGPYAFPAFSDNVAFKFSLNFPL